ncbi:MAG: sugar phosphate isomerase/epimerase [Gemmataceae bacterium]|nr:sugar phosphate isomerase/epimerase [Gemmataceae bacterium]
MDRRTFLAAGAAAAGASLLQAADKGPGFKLGLVTYNVAAAWDLATLLKACKATGVSPVELRTTHKHGVEPTLSKDQRKEVRKKFADAGVEVWGLGTTCDFHWPDEKKVKAKIEECKRFVELAADLGGKGVKVRPNDLPKGVEPARTLAQIGKALVPCGQAAADAGVEVWVEVHGHGTQHPPHMRTIMEECGHKSVGVTWNSNAADIKDGSVKEHFGLLKPWIKSCHINALWNDPKGYPYRDLFGLLKGMGYDRATLCEVGRTFKDPADGTEFLKCYKRLWEELCRG